MPERKPVLIGCPQYRVLVRGTCQCDEHGRYLRAADGEFPLQAVRCGQYDGRCTQTLCALHRFNRRGPGSWFPVGIWALREARRVPRRAGGPIAAGCADGYA